MMNLIYSILAFTCLAGGSAVKSSNSSAVTNASVTTVNTSGITYIAATPTSAITKYSLDVNQTAISYPLGIQKWAGQGCKYNQLCSNLHRPDRPLGTGFMVENQNMTLHYGLSYTVNFTSYSSFKISRPLREREQLDFSRKLGTDLCGKFLQSYWPRNSPGRNIKNIGGVKANVKQWDALILVHLHAFTSG